MIKFFSIIIITVVYSSFSFSQSTVKKYDNETAKKELIKIQQTIQSGTSYQVSTELLEFICNNYNTFPEIAEEMSTDQKLQELLPVQTQLTLIFKTMLLNKWVTGDSVSYKGALIMISLGHISARILPVANEFMKAFDKKDESYETRKKGMLQAFNGVKNTLEGYLITTFIENRNQDVSPILIDNIYIFGPQILHALPKDIRKDAIKYMKESIEPRVNDDLKMQYEQLYKKLRRTF